MRRMGRVIKKRVLYALFYCETHQSIGPQEMMGFANKNATTGRLRPSYEGLRRVFVYSTHPTSALSFLDGPDRFANRLLQIIEARSYDAFGLAIALLLVVEPHARRFEQSGAGQRDRGAGCCAMSCETCSRRSWPGKGRSRRDCAGMGQGFGRCSFRRRHFLRCYSGRCFGPRPCNCLLCGATCHSSCANGNEEQASEAETCKLQTPNAKRQHATTPTTTLNSQY